MNKYELMFIVKSLGEEKEVKNVVTSIESVLKDNKAKIIESKDLGLKKLAYPINKEINGYYHLINFEATKDVIAEINRKIRINESVIRHLIVNQEEE